MSAMHTINHEDGDSLSLVNYGHLGITATINYSGEWFDFGFGPDEIPALIEWLQAAQQNGGK